MENKRLKQVDGSHYLAPYQHWDLVVDLGLDYFTANATKYITRFEKKSGVKDLEKARSYLYKLLEEMPKIPCPPPNTKQSFVTRSLRLEKFLECNSVSSAVGLRLKAEMSRLLEVYSNPVRQKFFFSNTETVDQYHFVDNLKRRSREMIQVLDSSILRLKSVSTCSYTSPSNKSEEEGAATKEYVNQGERNAVDS